MLIHIAFRHYHQNNCQCKIIWDVFFFLVTKHHASQTAIPLLAMFENLNRIFSKVIVVVWPSELSSIRFRVSGYGIKILSCQTQEIWVQPFQLVLEQISYLHWNERIYCQMSVGIDIMFIFFSFCLIFYILLVSVCVFVCPCVLILSGQCFLSCWTFGTKHGMVKRLMIRGVMWKDWFAVFKVKVIAKASVIKMWLLMLWTAVVTKRWHPLL